MPETTITKIDSRFSPRGAMGQKYLASGKHLSMRLWEHDQHQEKESRRAAYETVGYVLEGRAELEIEGQRIVLEEGDSWVVPEGAEHRYLIDGVFRAVEATYPPAQIHGRDKLS